MPVVHIAVGNSDDKLTQARWAEYVAACTTVLRRAAAVIHGVWFSESGSPYQNACIAAEVEPGALDQLRDDLRVIRAEFDQDSVALNVSETEFV